MSKTYACPECGHVASAKAFEKATRQMIAANSDCRPSQIEITSLASDERGDCFYFCPSCDAECDGADFKEAGQQAA